MPSSSSIIDPYHGVASTTDLVASAAAVVPSRWRAGRGPEEFASFLLTQAEVDAICDKHGVPKNFTARPAGELRASSRPPPGAICVYARALEAGMPVPLHGFFLEALVHFGIAPTQVTPDGWRTMASFLVLCRSVGVRPSFPVFRRLFLLSNVWQRQGWYFFRSRDSSGLRFTGMPHPNLISIKYWKQEFFFLSSPEPWPCPVEWGEPSRSSFTNPVLTLEENKSAEKLLRAYAGAAIDLRKHLSNSNLAAAMATTASPVVPAPRRHSSSTTCIISSPEGSGIRKTKLAKKAAAQASASVKKVKTKPGSKAAGSPPLCGKKRRLKEANHKECPPGSMLNAALSFGVSSPPPGFSRKPQHFSARDDGDGTDWVATRKQLAEAKSQLASAKRDTKQGKAKAEFAATRAELAKTEAGLTAAEAEVVKAKVALTAKKRAADAGQEKARPDLAVEGAKARLAAAKRALEKELESAKAAAVHQLLRCEEHVRRRAEHALEGFQRWRTGRAPVARVD